MFKNPFSFKGRIRRTEYGLMLLIQFVYYMVITTIIFGNYSDQVVPVLSDLLIYLLALAPVGLLTLAEGTKRCHDVGLSGWFQLIPGFFIYMLIKSGEKGKNQYGMDPQDGQSLNGG
ncbi:hypothetical protein GCM10027566_29350 [Arachidicoccus ginsenosidivorans]|jgi:uncharacterized membrane protein YhaH (DUF805 family)|uniref:DUF805 domain-containing protein n=1 Tax=Arachidicoccus ginsenosidivorans TaxID=496057 RepID=A0A5B8VMX8_9BACT|nr:DUF805 domain-containing protein [Arachidicoccus ginsenosidivorans]QEC72850.1 DUF805 domain-containing protein [Arachidicoccus ginsenosidivorans]